MAISNRSPSPVAVRRAVVAALAFCAAASAAPAVAAVDSYLSLSAIPGPSTSLPGAIDIYSFSVGVSNPDPGKQQKAACGNLSVFKSVDETTPQLAQAVLLGQPMTTATLIYTKPVGDHQQTYFTITLPNAVITSDQISGSSENPAESVSLKAGTMTISFWPEKDDGSLGDPVVTTVACPK